MNDKEKDVLFNKLLKDIPKKTLKVPIPNGYNIINTGNNNKFIIMIAKKEDGTLMQYLIDEKLNENENFENHIEKVLRETKQAMNENSSIDFLEDFNSDLFQFKLYLQDIVKDELLIRQINAYFIEPESNYFYQISLTTPPFKKETVTQEITNILKDSIKPILSNIKYNADVPPMP